MREKARYSGREERDRLHARPAEMRERARYPGREERDRQ
jgi:hypothetical protein